MTLAIVGAVILVLAAVLALAVARRRDTTDAMSLSRETLRRDQGGVPLSGSASSGLPVLRGKEYERSMALVRTGTAIEPVRTAPPAVYVPPDPETLGVTRRQFLNRSIVGLFAYGLQAFGISIIAMLWPTAGGGFGSKLTVGAVDDVKAKIKANNGFLYVPEGRMWITEYPVEKIKKAEAIYSASVLNGMKVGLVALWQTCPHLGCRVPNCASSQWFECPCHGSKYNRVGEKRGGPAPRGMDRFGTLVDPKGNFVVDTGAKFQGPPIGTNTTGQEAEGPNCIGQAGGGH